MRDAITLAMSGPFKQPLAYIDAAGLTASAIKKAPRIARSGGLFFAARAWAVINAGAHENADTRGTGQAAAPPEVREGQYPAASA